MGTLISTKDVSRELTFSTFFKRVRSDEFEITMISLISRVKLAIRERK